MKYLHLGMMVLLLLPLPGIASDAAQPEPVMLWPNGAPGSQVGDAPESVRITELGEHVVSNVHRPSITPYLPAAGAATGAAAIVVPGGGHRELWMDHEGYRVGAWLRDHGIAAFVLKYRLARAPGSSYTVEGDELSDVQRAIRFVRSRSQEWRIAPDRIGVIGFSAGGELAALAATRYGDVIPSAADNIDRVSARPDFAGLIYPAIPKDLRLPKDMPPVFLLCGTNDAPEITDGTPSLYLAIRHGGGSAELHILDGAGHGFGLRDSNPPAIAIWTTLFFNWLGERGILSVR